MTLVLLKIALSIILSFTVLYKTQKGHIFYIFLKKGVRAYHPAGGGRVKSTSKGSERSGLLPGPPFKISTFFLILHPKMPIDIYME